MPAIKVTKNHFTGAGKLYDRKDGLDAIIRGLAIDHAQIKLQVAGIPDLTDNTTGTAGAALVDLNDAPASFNATSANGVQNTAFNTAIGKIKNAQKVLANSINRARTTLGLATITASEGTEAAADTLPAQDKTVTAGTGASAVTRDSYIAAAKAIKANQRKLERALNEVLVAAGAAAVGKAWTGSVASNNFTLAAIPATVTGTGPDSVSKADGDAFLTAAANNLATMAAKWNAAMNQTAAGALHVVAG